MKKIKEQNSFKHTPTINDNSDTITSTFEERNQILQEKRRNHQMQADQNELASCTFQPKITKLAQQRQPKNVEDFCYGDMMKKQAVQDRIQAQMEEQMKQDLTFKPNLVANIKNPDIQDIGSKLNLNGGGLDDFIKASQMEYERRMKHGEELRKAKENQDMLECTYRPQTTELPEYIRRIAEESKKIRHERHILEMQLPQSKPEWV